MRLPSLTRFFDPCPDRPRSKLVFFYCTIPFVLSALSVFAAIKTRRTTPSAPAIAIGSAMLGLVLWIVQTSLQGRCVLGNSLTIDSTFAYSGLCGFAVGPNWDPRTMWQTGLAVAYYETWCSILMIVL